MPDPRSGVKQYSALGSDSYEEGTDFNESVLFCVTCLESAATHRGNYNESNRNEKIRVAFGGMNGLIEWETNKHSAKLYQPHAMSIMSRVFRLEAKNLQMDENLERKGPSHLESVGKHN
jgi:hypothetical protein